MRALEAATATTARADPPRPLSPLARQRRARADERLFSDWVDRGDRRARALLIERFLPLARSVASRYQRSGEPFEDLVQVASVALVRAVDRYDPARGSAFSSFAVPTIAGELKRHFRDRTWAVRPPREVQELTLRVDAALVSLSQRLDRSPTAVELSAAVGVDVERILEALQARCGRDGLSLQAPLGEPGGAATLEDALGGEDPGFAHAERRDTLERLLRGVSRRAREILRLRFDEDMTQSEIAATFGISQMHVSRILRQTITELRRAADAADARVALDGVPSTL